MNITLKNIKSTATGAFSATVYLGDAGIGMVDNSGRGGPNRYAWKDAEAGRRLAAYAVGKFPQYKFEQLDHLIALELDRVATKKKLAKWCKKETIFRIPGEGKPGEWRSIKSPHSKEVAAYLRGRFPAVIIANEDLDIALRGWMQQERVG